MDTTFLVDWLRGNEQAQRKYNSLQSEADRQSLSASIITAYELQKGARISKNPVRDLKTVSDLLSELVILDLDKAIVDISSELYSELSKSGKLMGEFDIMIAATCIATNQALLTNYSDFDQITKLDKIHY